MMALEVIREIVGFGEGLVDRLVLVDALGMPTSFFSGLFAGAGFRRLVPKLARSRGPQRDRPSRIEVLVARENALALAVTKNHTASFEERLQASSMIRR
jgi:hypothetical protein